jgi:hypothetical protein
VVVGVGAEVVDEPVTKAGHRRVAVLWKVESTKTCPRRTHEAPSLHSSHSIDQSLYYGGFSSNYSICPNPHFFVWNIL